MRKQKCFTLELGGIQNGCYMEFGAEMFAVLLHVNLYTVGLILNCFVSYVAIYIS